MRPAFWWSVAAFVLLYVALLTVRTRLAEQRTRLEGIHLALDD